jgi:hypothetical protein
MMSACEIYHQGNTGEIFFKTIRQRLAGLFTDQPKEPDKDDFPECPDKFEPDDPTKYPHLTSDNNRYISGRSAQVIIRELKEQLNKVQVSRRVADVMGFQGSNALNGYIKREAEITAALGEIGGITTEQAINFTPIEELPEGITVLFHVGSRYFYGYCLKGQYYRHTGEIYTGISDRASLGG